MKRAQLAALWVATIVATWFIVRSQVDDRSASASAEPEAASQPSVRRTAPERPALVRHGLRDAPVDDAAFQTALATLEHDMADGRWSIADRDRLIASTRRVTGKQVAELYKVLFPKLNRGEVKSDIEGPPI